MAITILEFLGIVASVVAVILFFVQWIDDRISKISGQVKESSKDISGKLDTLSRDILELPMKLYGSYLELYRARQPKRGNPHPSRKDELLDKLQRRDITPEEGEELRRILEVEARQAEEARDIAGLLIILGVIALIAAVLSSRSR